MRIAVAGAGYVGLSVALLLSQGNDVTIVDVVPEKVDMLREGRSPIRDVEIEGFFPAFTSEHELEGRIPDVLE